MKRMSIIYLTCLLLLGCKSSQKVQPAIITVLDEAIIQDVKFDPKPQPKKSPCGISGCDCGCQQGHECFCLYNEARVEALRNGMKLVTFVGTKKRTIGGMMTCFCNELAGYPAPCIVVSKPFKYANGQEDLAEVVVLPSDSTDQKIVEAAKDKVSKEQPSAIPFISRSNGINQSSSKGQLAAADDRR